MCRPLALILILLAVLLKDHASSVHGQQAPPAVPLAAQNFFNEAESSVESLAANAILNYKNREGTVQAHIQSTEFPCSIITFRQRESERLIERDSFAEK